MLKTFTLLIVDDDEDDKEMFIEAVTEINPMIKCVKANNGYEALQILTTDALIPHYIFIDLNMPRMSGKQCLSSLKNDARLRNIPVVIYTTSKLAEDKEDVRKMGAVHFITKPSSMVTLKNELESFFNRMEGNSSSRDCENGS